MYILEKENKHDYHLCSCQPSLPQKGSALEADNGFDRSSSIGSAQSDVAEGFLSI
jgi:hypothetical protein